ncbi:electron transport complex subunit RsxC [Vibrio parahaemolyticus]|uniref:electron transport complex subunit RsxC n=9 Tax=Vibrio parahaemolyticus TaxID=670 RepID=UPI0005B38140|nr:electron transport complex subunit RsxC [Vibrio parahaemolyticus]EJB8572416.1 electron transport complex subunit RsxC [Vibrio parahaemolyticus]EJE4174889.1 electron transport complex subunit RsxC [Vibrio parahaemolyticus]ELB2950925.1 electron transport complex subunit RsxC [Vibrio parahaemolyticus]KJR18596.1 electron transporter RnfC [Vibrio parahaemolyticus]MCR9779868.1 electron transport complex subunit RsxC [Vibrio parahaemolyticus]
MLSLIEQIRTGSLWDFPGGVHPAENKKQSNKADLVRASIPAEIILPLKQHIGKAGNLLVSVGEHVLKGQALTQSETGFTVPVHAPTSGTITAIEPRTVAHPSGLSELCAVITPDGQDTWCEKSPIADYTQESADALIDIIRLAGISGMGGAGFPTAKKIQSGIARTEILIVNAAECEPYITADDKLMQEHAEELIQGIEIVEHILKPKLTIIGIEDNKPDAIKALESAALNKDIVIRVIPTKYPSGGEKQLIKILTNKEVPSGSIPADIGILVQNVGSLYSIKRAIIDGEPMIERVVTLTGKTFKQPRNVWALLGTPVQALLDEFGYKADKKLQRLIMGGPMMGFTLPHSQVPITKTANCILAPTRHEISAHQYEMECIRCGQCAEACPASLLPQQLQWHAKAEEYDKLEELNLKDCIECGACAFVCPSEIPLVQYYRQAKAEIRTRTQEAEAAERAKLRFEEKKARMEREKAERENRFKKAADDRRKEMKSTGGDDAIAAAIARVKAQKSNEDNKAEPAVKPAVAAAIAKAKAKQAAAAKVGATEPDNSEMAKLREERKRLARERKAEKEQSETPANNADDKKSAVAVAIARAKAKKAQQEENASEEPEDKKAAVAAAIARAKARKAQQETESQPVEETASQEPAEDPKKAAVAAAIARAKARKAQQETESQPVEETASQELTEDPKKAAVAAAIARAKARKAQQETESQPVEETASQEPTEDPKKAAVAAAIARAKARKAQQETESQPVEETASQEPAEDPKKAAVARAKVRKAQQETESQPVEETASQEPAEDPKKAAVAAAIARAKARKAQQETESQPVEETASQEPAEDPKKAAVAAAIARAKARKAQQETESQPVEETASQEPAEDPKKAAVAAAIARAKARKAQQDANKNNTEENE